MKKIIVGDLNFEQSKIFDDKEIIYILKSILDDNNMSDIKILPTDAELIARFSNDGRIYVNTRRLIAYAFLEMKDSKYNNKIEAINFRVIQIMLHEIEHINQFIEYDPFFYSCEKQEDNYKKTKTYNMKEYLCNPLERIAEIESNKVLLERYNSSIESGFKTDIQNGIYNNMLYGYFVDEYQYPLYYFFKNEIPEKTIEIDNMIIGEKISKKDYNVIKKLIVRR